MTYIFKTLKANRDRAQDIINELNELKQRELFLTRELKVSPLIGLNMLLTLLDS